MKKIEIILEVLGLAVGLTLAQLSVLYIMFKISIFEMYKTFFDRYLFIFRGLYGLTIYLLSSIFGDSILNNEVFFGMFMRMFFVIFLINLIYFFITKRGRV